MRAQARGRGSGAVGVVGRASPPLPATLVDDVHRLVAESSPDWEYITDGKVRLVYSSPSAEQVTGLTTEAMTADPSVFYKIVHPDDLPLVLRHDALLAGAADPSELEFRIIHPERGERWIGHICRPLLDGDGHFIGRRGTLRDITTRKAAERQLQMAQAVLDHIGDMAFIVGENGRPVYMNNSACRALGVARDEVTGLNVQDMEAGGITTHWGEYWEEIRRAGSRTFETLARSRDGGTFPVEVTVNYIEFEGRGYHCGFARDISERKAVQEALAESEARFRAMANTVPDILFTNAPDGRCDYVNQRFHDFTGLRPEAIEEAGWMHALHPDDRRRAGRAWERSVRDGVPFAEEARIRSADGTHRWFMIRSQPICCPAGTVAKWFGSATDIDQLKRAQEQLSEAHATLEDKVRQRTADLQAANVALRAEIAERRRLETEVVRIAEGEQRRIGQDLHDDLCQQLAAIAYLSDSVRPSIASRTRRAVKTVGRISELLHRALADARCLARGLSPLNLEARGLRAALKDLAAAVRASHGANCRVTCPEALLTDDATGATHIYRIVQEAVSNAVRHGKARVIRVALRTTRGQLRVTIEDDGRGLVPRGRRSKGIGLDSMRFRAHTLRGTFDIRRGHSGGTVVTCTVPLTSPAAAIPATPGRERTLGTA